MTKEEMITHLPLVQGVINRMANNSFLIKGWTVALVAAIFALSADNSNQKFIFIALVPIIVFWCLDSYYLKQEKLYRALYKAIVANCSNVNAFTMETENYETQCIARLMFTVSTGPFYFFLFSILLLVALNTNGLLTLDAIKSPCVK